MSSHDRHQIGPLGTEMSSSSPQDAQGLKIPSAGRSTGSALHRSACGDRHSASGRSDGRPFGDYRAWRARYSVPHRKVRSDPYTTAAAFLILPNAPRAHACRAEGSNLTILLCYYHKWTHTLILRPSVRQAAGNGAATH